MTHGLRLQGTLRDLAALRALADLPPDAAVLRAPWVEITAPAQRGCVVASPRLDEALAKSLAARGLAVVRVRSAGAEATFEPLDGAEPFTWRDATGRTTDTLLEALRPLRSHGDPTADEALFWVAPGTRGATQLLERLLLLGRDDVTLAEVEDRGHRALLVRVKAPPMYLLLRAREEPAEGVRAFARAPEGDLWVEWSYEHPLAALCARWLASADAGRRTALVEASGRWRFAPAQWPSKSIYDAITPALAAARVELEPQLGETRHTVALRLAEGPEALPELWLLNVDQFLALEALLDTSTSEEVARFTVARMAPAGALEASGTRYVLREIVRPSVPRLGTRVGDITGARGFARATGADNLYLPCGKRLLPVMRRDELRKLLGLDHAQLVVLDEDSSGPRLYSLRSLDEAPLTRWVDYVATDRRVELDRLLESSVFELPEVAVEKPAREKPKAPEAPPSSEADAEAAARIAAARAARREKKPAEAVDEGAASGGPAVTAEDLALREEMRGLEQRVAEGGCDDPAVWERLGRLKLRFGQPDEAGACLEAALFHREPDARSAELAGLLVRARQLGAAGRGDDDELVELLVRSAPSPADAAYAGARVLELALRGDARVETVAQAALKQFSDAGAPVSRRLAWLVLAQLCHRARDPLGMTRAKERVLGRMNDRGLDESYDLPAFVRFALALDGDAAHAGTARARGELLGGLEDLQRRAAAKHLRELDSLAGYIRVLFAVGFTRLGVSGRARDLLAPLEAELPAHDAPNQVLYRLYMARMAHVATQGSAEVWKSTVDAQLATVRDNRTRDRVEWLRKRSLWLRTESVEETAPYIRSQCEKLVAAAEATPQAAPEAVEKIFEVRGVYDYEVTQVLERAMKVALRSGNDALVAGVLAAATPKLGSIAILGHRALALGVCIRGAATLNDGAALDGLLDQVLAIAGAPQLPPVRDLLLAVHPALAALRRVGETTSAGRLLEALTPIAKRGGREGLRLQAALADGYLQLREPERADELLDGALLEVLTATLDNVGRYEAGAAVLDALQHWPSAVRGPRCAKVFDGLDEFRDTYTMKDVYATHKVLLLERLVDAVTDEVTLRTDRVQGYLDREEHAVRRRVLREWRDACGR